MPRTPLPNPFSRALGQRIRAARLARGMSQEELAALIQRRRPAISEMENGKMEPDVSTLLHLARALEKPLDYFVSGLAAAPTDQPSADEIKHYIRRAIWVARQAAGLSQADIAVVLGKTRAAVSDVERGRVDVSAQELYLMAVRLGKDPDFFFPPR